MGSLVLIRKGERSVLFCFVFLPPTEASFLLNVTLRFFVFYKKIPRLKSRRLNLTKAIWVPLHWLFVLVMAWCF